MNVRGILRKKEQNKMTQVPSASAIMYESFDWPAAESVEGNINFNCLRYELSDGAHLVISADAKGI